MKKNNSRNNIGTAVTPKWLMTMFSQTEIPWKQTYILLLIALFVNCILVGLTYALYAPQFNTADDVQMMLLLAGKIIALHPTEYVIHSNVLFGKILSTLYTAIPLLHWYEYCLITAVFIAHTVILWLLLQRMSSWLTVLFFILYWIVYGAYIALSLQYTMIGETICIAGMMCLLSLYRGDYSRDVLWSEYNAKAILGCTLIVFAWMVRWKSALLVIGCFLPLIVWGYVMKKESRKLLAISIISCISVISIIHSYNAVAYSKLDRQDILAFDEERAKFHDERILQRTFLTGETLGAILSSVGWTANDLFLLIYQCFYIDTKIYTTNALHTVASQIAEQENIARKSTNLFAQDAINRSDKVRREWFWQKVWQIVTYPYSLASFLVCCFWSIILISADKKQSLVPLFLFIIMMIAGVLYISSLAFMRHQLQDRVFYPMFIPFWFLPLLYPDNTSKNKKQFTSGVQTLMSGIILGVVAVFSFWSLVRYRDIDVSTRQQRQFLQEYIAELHPQASNLYVHWENDFFAGITPFASLDFAPHLHIFWFSWQQLLPSTQAMLTHYGIKDLSAEMAMRGNILHLMNLEYLTSDYYQCGERYQTFLKEHYKVNCTEQRRTIYQRDNSQPPLLEVKFQLQK